MLLALDIGNTSIHLGLFDGETLKHTWRIGVEQEKLPDEYGVLILSLLATGRVTTDQNDDCIIGCDVPPLIPTFETVCKKYFGMDPTIMRLIWVVLFFATGIPIVVYPICWIVMARNDYRALPAGAYQQG